MAANSYQQMGNMLDEMITLVRQMQENSSTPSQMAAGFYDSSHQQQYDPYSATYNLDYGYGSDHMPVQPHHQYYQQPYQYQQQSYAPHPFREQVMQQPPVPFQAAPPIQVNHGPSFDELMEQMAMINAQMAARNIQFQQDMLAINKNLQPQIGYTATSMNNLQQTCSGTLPVQPIVNLMANESALILSSGTELDKMSAPVLTHKTEIPPHVIEEEEEEEEAFRRPQVNIQKSSDDGSPQAESSEASFEVFKCTKEDISFEDISSEDAQPETSSDREVGAQSMYSDISNSLTDLSPSSSAAYCTEITTPHVSSINYISSPQVIEPTSSLSKLDCVNFKNKLSLSNLVKEEVANNTEVNAMLEALKDTPLEHEIVDNLSTDVAIDTTCTDVDLGVDIDLDLDFDSNSDSVDLAPCCDSMCELCIEDITHGAELTVSEEHLLMDNSNLSEADSSKTNSSEVRTSETDLFCTNPFEYFCIHINSELTLNNSKSGTYSSDTSSDAHSTSDECSSDAPDIHSFEIAPCSSESIYTDKTTPVIPHFVPILTAGVASGAYSSESETSSTEQPPFLVAEADSDLTNLDRQLQTDLIPSDDVSSKEKEQSEKDILFEIIDKFFSDAADLYIDFAISNICAATGSTKSECLVPTKVIIYASDFEDKQVTEFKNSGEFFPLLMQQPLFVNKQAIKCQNSGRFFLYMPQPLMSEEEHQFYVKLIEQEPPPPEPPPSYLIFIFTNPVYYFTNLCFVIYVVADIYFPSSAKNPPDPH